MSAVLLGALVLTLAPVSPAPARIRARAREIDVRCVPEQSLLQGSATIALREPGQAARALRFRLYGELAVTAVRAEGRPLEYTENRIQPLRGPGPDSGREGA